MASGFHPLLSSQVVPLPCRQPRWASTQTIIRSEPSYAQAIFPLDGCHENLIMTFNNVLSPKQLQNYLSVAVGVDRVIGRAPHGAIKPRKEICYSLDGQQYVYSGISHESGFFPPHIFPLLSVFQELVEKTLREQIGLENVFNFPTSASDLLYDNSFPRGGSCGCHKDNERDWGMVMIYSLGQTRWLRIKAEHQPKNITNAQLVHNSLVVMYGRGFFDENEEERYTHQVDKLHPDEEIGARLSLNIRFERKPVL